MYDIRQFKPVLYALLLLGVLGYGLAAEAPAVWFLGTVGMLLNAWLTYTGRFTPLPRFLANIITLGSMFFIIAQVAAGSGTPVLVIGQFLVLLQLVKLWEQRANRDYAQLLVLSLLLMVAAAINTASLGFGLLLGCYLLLSLYVSLLFHLKVERDAAIEAQGPHPLSTPPAAAVLQKDQRSLSRSMRRLTGIITVVALAVAVGVFIFFPRGAGANMLGGVQLRASQSLTGFSDQVSFEQVARISQNNEVVAHVQVSRNGAPVGAQEPLLLRGVTLDTYSSDARSRSRSKWTRSRSWEGGIGVDAYKTQALADEPGGVEFRQRISLKPTGTNVLFALPGVEVFTPYRDVRIRYTRRDGTLQLLDALQQPLEYEVVSTGSLGPSPTSSRWQQFRNSFNTRSSIANNMRQLDLEVKRRIQEYALRPDVSGSDAQGPLAPRRRQEVAGPLDEAIARNIEHHLQSQFAYTLDLTDADRDRNQDPLVSFLYDLKRGHCEYFAGAMALMCQTLGIESRVVVGFKCDEYNAFSDQFIVRQSHAHAWVEVLTAAGWMTFDPTSSQDPRNLPASQSLTQKLKHLLDYMEFTYAKAVIAYDNENRENLVQNVENQMLNTAIRGNMMLARLRDWFDTLDSVTFWNISSKVFAAGIVMMFLALAAVLGWFLWERWMLRRRAARIGLEALPASAQKRLARQLAFYDDLLKLLARHQITRPAHLTPREFSRSLTFLPGGAYETVRRLTDIFYRVRYGGVALSGGQRQRLHGAIGRLGGELNAIR